MSKMEDTAEDLAKKALIDITNVLERHDNLIHDIRDYDHNLSDTILVKGLGGVIGAIVAHMLMRRKEGVTQEHAKGLLVAAAMNGLNEFMAQPAVQEKIDRGTGVHQAAARDFAARRTTH